MLVHTFQIFLVENVLRVEHCEHLVVQYAEETVHHHVEVCIASCVVPLQLLKQLFKDVRVLFVDHAVRTLEHRMELFARLLQQPPEEFVKFDCSVSECVCELAELAPQSRLELRSRRLCEAVTRTRAAATLVQA